MCLLIIDYYLQPGIEPGDVIIVLQLKEHDSFTRRGDDLIFKKTVSLTEALCGVSFVIKHLDGRNILLTTKCGDVIEPGNDDDDRVLSTL
jgi:DnaJ family protein A protein 2